MQAAPESVPEPKEETLPPTPEAAPTQVTVSETGEDTAGPAPETPRSIFRLYFVRHAPAGDRASFEGDDAQRPLTEKGRKILKREGKGLREVIGMPDAILTSPYARAQESAEILAKQLRFTGQIQPNDHLVHGGRAEMLAQVLTDHAGERDIVLVGHSPDLERWISAITTGRESPSFLELKKGGVCRVDVTSLSPELRGVVRWVLTPAILAELD